MIATNHILEAFNTALNELRSDLRLMADLVERNLRNAKAGMLQRDDDLCTAAIADDEEIDALEKEVDKKGVDLLRRFQPVASDLREIVSAMKLNSNLERVADQAVNIAKKARKLNRTPPLADVRLLEPMFEEALGMFSDAWRSFTERDVELAQSIKLRDKAVDAMNVEAAKRFAALMPDTPDRVLDYVNLIFIAQHLERVGDHAKNIAEEVVYVVSAQDIRHLRSSDVLP